jgi:thiamine biosynthesis lipoprotein
MAFFAQSHRQPAAPASTSAASLHLRKLVFRALGIQCEVQYAAPGGDAQAADFERGAIAWVAGFEAKYSRFIPESLLSRINAAAGHGWVEVDAEMEQMFKLCDTLHFTTQGVLDPTALPLTRLWDWKTSPPSLPSDEAVASARKLVGWPKVRRSPGKVFLPEPGMALDFGGFGKEYAADMVAQLAAELGIGDVLVDFGHDLCARGAPPGRTAWNIGLEDPRQPGAHRDSVALAGSRGIALSGDTTRCFTLNGRRYGNIIDPRTGWPVANGCAQATVIAATCLQAGVLSTTAFVLGIPTGIEFIQSFPGAEGLLVAENARAQTRRFYEYVVSE